jgi:nicotinate-nucleotide pyrophosphorylase (carboxylating)
MDVDLRDEIFRSVTGAHVTAVLTAEQGGLVTCVSSAAEAVRELGLLTNYFVADGSMVRPGQVVLEVEGTPKAVAKAEEVVIGIISKPSGICTAAHAALQAAAGNVRVVVGAWKKVPSKVRHEYRALLEGLAIDTRISTKPFVYLDKNYVRIFGGVEKALAAVKRMTGYCLVVQIRGEYQPVEQEAVAAVLSGASIIMVDTGEKADLHRVVDFLNEKGLRRQVKVAFAGNIKIEDIPALSDAGADILDIGAAIIDAPMLKVRFDVVQVIPPSEG